MKYCLNNVFSDVLLNVLLESIDSFSLRRRKCFIDSLLYSLNSLLVSLYMVCPGLWSFTNVGKGKAGRPASGCSQALDQR